MKNQKRKGQTNTLIIAVFLVLVLIVLALIIFQLTEKKEVDNSLSASENTSETEENTAENTVPTVETTAKTEAGFVITMEGNEETTTLASDEETTENSGETKATESETTTAESENSADADDISAYMAYSFFDSNLTTRYIDYKEENPNYSYEQAVTHVNIGLDNPFYSVISQVSDPASVDVLCNKYNSLGDYTPSNLVMLSSENSTKEIYLRQEAAAAFEQLCNDAKEEGYTITGASGYRDYDYQAMLYQNYSARDGAEEADTFSARPGHSEHQTGLAIDVQGSSGTYVDFKNTPEYQYVLAHAHEYGYIVRYTEEGQHITGYMPEAWHLRYLGVDLATEIRESGLTYDEYYVKHLAS